jgi:hypothetical protein
MARIRSIHPRLFTDDAFASCSPMARLLAIGIWTEAWDDGVFEWKALSLKMRIFPADSVDVSPLLDELSGLNIVKSFEAGGRKYGAVRNFCRFQRPKKPNLSKVLPNSLREFVGLSGGKPAPDTEPGDDECGTGSEPVPNQSMPGSENAIQKGGREEGRKVGRERGSSETEESRQKRAQMRAAFDRFWASWPHKVGRPAAERAFAKCWREVDAILAGVESYIRSKPPDRPWLNPATFLNQRRWEDAPASLPLTALQPPPQRSKAFETSLPASKF